MALPDLQPATATASTQNGQNLTHPRQQSTSAATAPLRKVEPSFAWNDDDMVADLLARDAATEQVTPAPVVPSTATDEVEQGGQVEHMTPSKPEQAAIDEPEAIN